MDNKKNTNLGEEILNIVQSAINNNDFTKLNSDIRATVETALNEVREWLRYKEPAEKAAKQQEKISQQQSQNQAGEQANQQQASQGHFSFMSSSTVQYKPPVRNQSGTGQIAAKQNTVTQTTAKQNVAKTATKQTTAVQTTKKQQVAVPSKAVGKVAGTMLCISGGFFICAGIGQMVFNMALRAFIAPVGSFVLPNFSLPIGIIMLVAGLLVRKRNARLNSYLSVLRIKGFATIKELARSVDKSERYVLKDLKKMVSLGVFPEGHFDDDYTCFMANNSAYQQYRITQDNYYEKQSTKEPETIIDESKIKNDRVRAVIKEGNDYIAKIRQINDELPDEEISNKLDTLETTITKIFFQVEEHPEQLPELDKFLKYYMPTTMKLLNVYRDFDKQPIQGENITTAKAEILESLDTINHAFIKLFDSLFQATAWDVSTDITVLQTMLANEGLTPDAMTNK